MEEDGNFSESRNLSILRVLDCYKNVFIDAGECTVSDASVEYLAVEGHHLAVTSSGRLFLYTVDVGSPGSSLWLPCLAY